MHKFQLLLDDLDESMISVFLSNEKLDERCIIKYGYWSWRTLIEIKNKYTKEI